MDNENKLPEDFKKRWVAALRSGEYEQYRGGAMCNMDHTKFCCLAVAGILHGVPISELRNSETYDLLPEPLTGYCVIDGCIAEKLVIMNDSEGKSFNEIADYIEENL